MLTQLELSDVMVRRSSRLQAGNYYTLSNGRNSPSVATVSYYETPVRSHRRSRVHTPRQKSRPSSFAKGLQPESSSTIGTGRSSRIPDFFFTLKAETTSSRRTKTACSLLLLLFLGPFYIWFLVPLLTPVTPNDLLMVDLSLRKKLPVYSDPPQQNSNTDLRPTLEKMFQEMQERKASIEKARLLICQQQMLGFRSVAARLLYRIRSLEAHNLKLRKEWQHLQQRPEASRLSPELRRDLGALFRKLVAQERGVLAARGGCSHQRPIADRMADFALESQGAGVISSRCSQTYTSPSPCVTLFGIPLWSLYRSPRVVIQGSPIMAGSCWPFAGAEGTLAVSLSHPVKITHVTVDHLPRHSSPTGDIKTAPKDLELYGMKSQAAEGTFLLRFRYDRLGEPTQTFSLPNPTEEAYKLVELHVLSNWGQKDYTCLYRFRVHGQTDVS